MDINDYSKEGKIKDVIEMLNTRMLVEELTDSEVNTLIETIYIAAERLAEKHESEVENKPIESLEEYLHDIWKDDPYYQVLDEEERKMFLQEYLKTYQGMRIELGYRLKILWEDVTKWIGR